MNKCLKLTCLWIKSYKHPLRVFGGIFFGLALLSGVFWMCGFDIEPIAFFLGMMSSFFLASPSVAEYFLPDRKPVRHMNFDEILEFIPKTGASEDWHGVSREWASERFFKEDPRLRFRAKFIDDGVHCEDFAEDWATSYPSGKATSYWYELYYDGAFLDRFILVSVDGGRADMPLPDLQTKKISLLYYHVAKIHDASGSLDDYIRRSGLSVNSS